MLANVHPVITSVSAERLRIAAEVCEDRGLEPLTVTVSAPCLRKSTVVHLSMADFRAEFAGERASVKLQNGYRYYSLVVDGIEFTACERGEEEEGTVTL